jgi:hypothetical protein
VIVVGGEHLSRISRRLGFVADVNHGHISGGGPAITQFHDGIAIAARRSRNADGKGQPLRKCLRDQQTR